jgi:hypothetical protein
MELLLFEIARSETSLSQKELENWGALKNKKERKRKQKKKNSQVSRPK